MPIPPLASPATVAFLHTASVHVATFDALIGDRLPAVHATHLVDETLLSDARATGITDVLTAQVAARLRSMAAQHPSLIVCTCSTIGAVAERAGASLPCPVVRVDRPMAEAAILLADRRAGPVGLAAALESTVAPTQMLLRDVAREAGIEPPEIRLISCFHAWPAFEACDPPAFGELVADAVRRDANDVAVIVLAQASMAAAVPFLEDVRIPVLTSPRQMVDALAKALASPIQT